MAPHHPPPYTVTTLMEAKYPSFPHVRNRRPSGDPSLRRGTPVVTTSRSIHHIKIYVAVASTKSSQAITSGSVPNP